MADRIETKPQTQLIAAAPKFSHRQHSADALPIFVHSSFRTGSTWLWSKIRQAPTALAYYEIFHEALPPMTPAQARNDSQSWESGHPVAAAYFLEFLPFLSERGGLSDLHRPSSMSGWIPAGGPDGDLSCADELYVTRLIKEAQGRHLIPVLTCTRALGRARALRRVFGGVAVFLHRNLFHQWASYSSQQDSGNPYFMNTIFQTIEAAPQDPYLQAVAEWYDIHTHPASREVLFEVFILIHLYMYSIIYDAADIIIDMNQIARQAEARQKAETQISDIIHYPIDLSDAQETFANPAISISQPSKTRDTLQQFAKLIPTHNVSMDGVDFVWHAMDAAFEEWERYELLSRRTLSVMTAKIGSAEARASQQTDKLVVLSARIEQLELQLANASATYIEQTVSNAEEIKRLTSLAAALIDDKHVLTDGLETERARNISLQEEYEFLKSDFESKSENLSDLCVEIGAMEKRAVAAESQLEAFCLRLDANSAFNRKLKEPRRNPLSTGAAFVRRNLSSKIIGYIDEPGNYAHGPTVRCSGWIVSPHPIETAFLMVDDRRHKLELYERNDVRRRYARKHVTGWHHAIAADEDMDTTVSIKLIFNDRELCATEFAWVSRG